MQADRARYRNRSPARRVGVYHRCMLYGTSRIFIIDTCTKQPSRFGSRGSMDLLRPAPDWRRGAEI